LGLREKEVNAIPEEPFKSRGEVKAEIRRCDIMGTIFSMFSLVCVLAGIIGEVLSMTLGLEPMSWFLLAIVFSINAIMPTIHSVAAKHLFGIDAERKEK
jgi:hypothetical protein